MTPLFKNLVIALIITLLLSAAYLIFGRSSDVADITLNGMGMNSALMMRSQEILDNTSRIDGYRLDTDVLSDRRFASFTNTRVDLNALDIRTGRTNPFSPVQ